MNDPAKSSNFASRILALKTPAQPASEPEPKAAPQPAAPIPTPADRPASSQPAARGIVVEEWAYDWEGFKPHRKHVDLVRAGTDPHDIQHIAHGFDKGCACHDCMVRRGRGRNLGSGSTSISQAKDPAIALLPERFYSKILNLPNRVMELVARLRHYPKEAVDVWQADAEELRWYGEAGKALADHYLQLPDFKHKALVMFGLSYSVGFGEKVMAMLMITKHQEQPK